MTLDALKSEIAKLPQKERAVLAAWLIEKEESAWDEQIKADFESGKLDSLIRHAERELKDGTIREAP